VPSADAYSGDTAMRCQNVSVPVGPFTYTVQPGYVEQTNISINDRPICLTGAFKIIDNVEDTLFVNLTLKKNGNVIGSAQYTATGDVPSYSVFCITPIYTTTDVPNSYDLRIGFNQFRWHGNSSVSTYLLIDAVELLRPNVVPESYTRQNFKIANDCISNTFEVSAKDGSTAKFDIRLLTVEGSVLYSEDKVELPFIQSTSCLCSGMYVLQIISENGKMSTFKIIKQA
jgi:hypothetical protein